MTWSVISQCWNKRDVGSKANVLDQKCTRTLYKFYFWSRNKLGKLNKEKVRLEADILHI